MSQGLRRTNERMAVSASLLEWMSERIRYFIRLVVPSPSFRPRVAASATIARHFGGRAPRRVHHQVREAVARLALGEKRLDCLTIRRQRSTAVVGDARQQRVAASQRSHTVSAPALQRRARLGLRRRRPARRRSPRRSRVHARSAARLCSAARKPASPSRREDLGHRSGRSRASISSSRSTNSQPELPRRGAARPCVLPAPMKPTSTTRAAGGRRRQRSAFRPRSSSDGELGEGDRDAARRLRSRVSPSAARAAMASAMAMRWSPCERTARPAERPAAADGEAVGALLDARLPARRSPSARAAMRSLSLTRSSAAPRDAERALGAQAAATARIGQLVDEDGHARPAATLASRAAARSAASIQPTGSGAPRATPVSMCAAHPRAARRGTRCARGFSSTPSMRTTRVGHDEGGHDQERGAGDVAGDVHGERGGARRRPRRRRVGAAHVAPARRTAGSRRSVWSRLAAGSRDRRPPLGLQAGEQDRRLHLRAGDRSAS